MRKTLREYQELALRFVWEVGEEGANSGAVWRAVNERLSEGKSILRAFVILFLNDMVDDGVLGFREATGKGGHHRVYVAKLDENGYRKYLLRAVVDSMMRDFPEETCEVLKEYKNA
ncbi:MAG: hypothetical protein HWN66_17980 [Candidatus Helarchaeota archaeon]|nr:hypothetical protein [Candidatus Helarchaeota archaeon]